MAAPLGKVFVNGLAVRIPPHSPPTVGECVCELSCSENAVSQPSSTKEFVECEVRIQYHLNALPHESVCELSCSENTISQPS